MFLEVFKSYDVFKSQGVMFSDPNKTDDDALLKRQNTLNLISSRDHCQRFSTTQISDTSQE